MDIPHLAAELNQLILSKLESEGIESKDNTAFIGLVLTTIEGMGLKILPAQVESSATVVDQFQQVVSSLTATTSKEVASEIHGAAILEALTKKGWTILVPRTGEDLAPSNEISQTQVRQFEHQIVQHCTIPKVEPEDVSGYAILHALASSGWIIIPPQ